MTALTAAVFATLAFLALVSWNTWNVFESFGEISTQQVRLQRLVGTIVHLDEVLTMSARMAAVTGEPRWEARYRQSEPALDAAIKQSIELTADAVAEAAEATDDANRQLVAMENQAFELVRQGRRLEAVQVLFSDVYEANKRRYAGGMQVITASIDERIALDVARAERRVARAGIFAAVSAAILLMAWVAAVGLSRRHRDARGAADEERRQLQERMQHAQKLESLGILAGGIAHDFNNLLTGILTNAGTARDKLASEDPAQCHVAEVIQAAQMAAHLTAQLLAYAGMGRFEIRPLDLSSEVRAIEALLGTSMQRKARLALDLADGLPAIEGDAAQIHQVLMNLAMNAAESLDGEVNVRIRTRAVDVGAIELGQLIPGSRMREGPYVALEVQDSGRGMDAQTRMRIFDPFFTTKVTGRGLGLAATLGIVHGHGGGISLRSSPGEGSEFRVFFPPSDRPAESASGSAPVSSPSPVAHAQILVVDDDLFVRDAVYFSLRSVGHSVLVAEDGRRALEIFRERADEVDLVLLDMTMPGMSGEETFLALREIRPRVRVLFSSGYQDDAPVRRFVSQGLVGFLRKPYDPEGLAAAVAQLLGGVDDRERS